MYNHVQQLVSCRYKHPTGELPISIIYKIQELKKLSFLFFFLNFTTELIHKSFAVFNIIFMVYILLCIIH
jgi:hypothetical protein